MKALRRHVWVPFRIATCFINYDLGGSIFEPLCSRVWRSWARDNRQISIWSIMHVGLNLIFFYDPDHCYKQFLKTVKRRVDNKWSIKWLWLTF